MSIDQSKGQQNELDREAVLEYLRRGENRQVSAAILRTNVSWFGPSNHQELIALLDKLIAQGLIILCSEQPDVVNPANRMYELRKM